MWLASVKVSLLGSWITDFREGPQEALTGQRMKVVGTRVVAEELPSWMLLPAGEGRHTWPCTPLDLTSEAPVETGGGSLDLCSGRGPVGNGNGWVSLPHPCSPAHCREVEGPGGSLLVSTTRSQDGMRGSDVAH